MISSRQIVEIIKDEMNKEEKNVADEASAVDANEE